MLALNDELTSLLARVNARRPELKRLKGLGINVEDARLSPAIVSNGHASSDHLRPEEAEEDELEEEIPVTPRIDKGKGRAEPEPEEPPPVLSPTLLMPDYDFEYAEPTESLLGQVESIVSPTDRYVHFSQMQLSKTLIVLIRSSRSWVTEEGEVFRKGAVLLTPEEMEGEYDSEDLRREVCEIHSLAVPVLRMSRLAPGGYGRAPTTPVTH